MSEVLLAATLVAVGCAQTDDPDLSSPITEITCGNAVSNGSFDHTPGRITSADDPRLNELRYVVSICGFKIQPGCDPTWQIPQVAVQYGHGWLLGSDRGEWGGELVYLDKRPEKVLLDDNVHDIYRLPFGYVVLAGLAHLSTNRGHVYLVNQTEAVPDLKLLHVLPGAPRSSWILRDDTLLINTDEGVVLLDSTGALRRAHCSDAEPANNALEQTRDG